MRVEEVVGRRIREAREAQDITQEDFGKTLGRLLGKPWPRQAVSAAEKGQRAFTAAELVGIAVALGRDVADMFRLPADSETLTMPSGEVLTGRDVRGSVAPVEADEVREILRDFIRSADQMQRVGFHTAQRARQLHDTVDRLLTQTATRGEGEGE